MASKGQRWVVDSGILRKKTGEEEPQELLVFGYSCKLFRDDEKAKLIDQGKHLIPWMGDSTLKIDRYDGRGALGDLRIYEPPPGGIDYRTILTEDEYKVEQVCDEERYRSLYNNDAEETLYHEEEIKRLHQALDSEGSYSQVGFNYDDEKKSGEDSQSPKQSEGSHEEDEAFVPEPALEIPENMTVPETQKLNAIIIKTALFISRQGSQMEILIKAKQANNPQFSFLSIDGELHPYYKHVLGAIKSGKYNPEKQPEKEESEPESESEEDDEPYLHPSLASSLKVEAAPSIPSINYKPSADCAYSMLVNKITGKPPASKLQQQQQQQQQQQPPPPQEVIPPPPMPPIGFYHAMPSNFPPFPPPPQQYAHGPVLYGVNGNAITPPMPQIGPVAPSPPATNAVQTPQKEPAPLVPYGPTPPKPLSRPSFIVPPADIQIIIDKMASYVAKNGRDFEAIVKNKGDPRFSFLELSHQYHGYYAHKLTMYEGAINPRVLTEEELLQKQELQEEKQKKLEELQKKQQRMEEVQKRVKMIQAKKMSESSTRQSPSKQVTTVSFSIKKPKEGEGNVIEKRNALPLEESDDETSDDKKETNTKPESPVPIKEEVPLSPKAEKEPIILEKPAAERIMPDRPISERLAMAKSSSERSCKSRSTMEKPLSEKLLESKRSAKSQSTHVPVSDFVDLTDDIFEDCQKEIREKQTDDKLRDRMLVSAQKKLAVSREKQLQMERRKKAAMFLSQIQAPTIVKPEIPVISITKEEPPQPPPSYSPPTREDIEIEELRINTNSLMSRLRGVDASNKRSRRSRSRSPSYADRHRSHKKHKKKKSTHRSYRESVSSSRSHKTKKSKKSSSKHRSRSRSRSPHRHHTSSRHRRESSSSDSNSSSS
ncbi:splicing factor, suppressor of white-apricot homolog isoform X2 [Nasonia vitripennis]|uniref:SURP motif domain-containing protein n=1 Tax=Nasonia vitripennis TaxID=7425 RepID=A0A7M7IPS2_NASVI|nr:splicing factor, suppressor of white-apricot homolog isoform X2 [Nasonia vitripennis]